MSLSHVLTAVALAAGITVVGCMRAEAQPSRKDLINAGRLIAKRYCGECHAVDPGATSPLADAPPLPGVYRRFPVDLMAEALELGLMDDHPRMPNFNLDADEREAITAYLKSYQPRRSDPLPSQNGAARAYERSPSSLSRTISVQECPQPRHENLGRLLRCARGGGVKVSERPLRA